MKMVIVLLFAYLMTPLTKKLNLEMLANSIDGFIMSLSKETQLKAIFTITEVINQGMPVVMFDRVTNEVYVAMVIIDDKAAAYEGTKFN
jgi:LacI family transcriptional regulator